jgi:hypothetical protein
MYNQNSGTQIFDPYSIGINNIYDDGCNLASLNITNLT